MAVLDLTGVSVAAPRVATATREHIYPAIVDNMRDGVLAFDGDGRIIAMNQPARTILNFEEGDWTGKSFAEEMIARGDLVEVNDAIVDAIYAPNNVLTREVTVGKGADERNLVIRTSMLRDQQRRETAGVVAIISDVSDQIRALRERVEFGRLIVLFVSTMAIANFTTLIVDRYLHVNVYSPAFAWTYLIMIALPVIGTVVRLGYSPSAIGLTFANWRQATLEGLLVSAVLVAVMAASVLHANPELSASALGDYVRLDGLAIILLFYAPHSFLQEVLARGVLQNALRRVLNDQRGIVSIVIASLVFGLFHSHYGLVAIAVTMLSGLIFGWLYVRHGNLIGVTIVHVLAGLAAFALKIV